MQIRRHKKEKPEKQIFIGICPDRHPALRQMRAEIPPGNMGKKRQKEDRLEMLEPPGKRGKEMRGFRKAGRGRIKQGGHGGHPPHHKKRGRFCRRIPAECYPGDRQLRKGTAARRIHRKQEEMVALIAENAKTRAYTQEFDERYRRIAEEINALKEEQAEAGKKKKLAENYEQRVKDMDAFLSGNSGQIPEFDNDLVRRLVASIKVISADRIQIQFQSGIVMEQEIGNE